jgi:acyl-CoA dehydrogenase
MPDTTTPARASATGPGSASPAAYRSPWRTAEHDDLARTVRTFFTREVVPHQEEFIARGYPDRALYRRAGELGLLGLSVPEEYGGGGGTFEHEAVLFDEQTRSGDATLGLMVHCGILPPYLLDFGTEEQRQRWLPGLCSGENVWSIAMTEPGAGSDLQGITTRAVRDGDEYVVTGEKTFITNGWLSDRCVVAVKTDRAQGARGISLLVVDLDDDAPGFRRGPVIHKVGLQGNDTGQLFFDGLRVPADNLLGPAEGLGFGQMMAQLPQERLVIALLAVAAMDRAVELTTEYTRTRTAFGEPLFALQNTRFTLAECATLARVGRTFADDCIARHVRGELDVAAAAMAKFWLTEQQGIVVDRCLQLFGGYGFTLEYPIARMFADARVQRIYAGANEVMKELVARAL